MSSQLIQELEKSLKAYSIYVEYWDIQCGDTFLMAGERDFLQKHQHELTAEQQQTMRDIDVKVMVLLAAVDYHLTAADDDDDLTTLQLVGKVINGYVIPPPNPDLLIKL